jgi:transposase, IS30 family
MINITERPAQADDRAIPGHWEGDLIIGKNNATAIGTLVERTTGYTMLVHLPDGYKAEHIRDALTAKIKTIPDILRASLTWDQGPEMRDWKEVSVAADIDIYFWCATRRFVVSPAQPGGTRRRVPGSAGLPGSER